MGDEQSSCLEDASSMAMICRIAAEAHQPSERIQFLDALLADLSEARDDLAHQDAVAHHHPHEP